jgi:hypothetical protein
MATHTVASAISSSRLLTAASPHDSFPGRENALPPQPSNSRSNRPTLLGGRAANGPQHRDKANLSGRPGSNTHIRWALWPISCGVPNDQD